MSSVGLPRVHTITQRKDKVTQDKFNQGEDEVTQDKLTWVDIITWGKVTLGRVTWCPIIPSLVTQGKDRVSQGKVNLGR